MRIETQENDALGFIVQIEALASALLRAHRPRKLMLVRLDNWFGPRWLTFSTGIPVRREGFLAKHLDVPRFVPNRVDRQRKFVAPLYDEVAPGEPVHRSLDWVRKMADMPSETAYLWFSGNSGKTLSGSAMVYLPVADRVRAWYASWNKRKVWQLRQTFGIPQDEVARLIGVGLIPAELAALNMGLQG
jgi:hypothetical protein